MLQSHKMEQWSHQSKYLAKEHVYWLKRQYLLDNKNILEYGHKQVKLWAHSYRLGYDPKAKYS